MNTAIQIIGLVIILIGAFMLSYPFGVMVSGAVILAAGVVIELVTRRRADGNS